ncbi:hypothetical protein PCANC_02157 [Puccinia coronata f. sp. avenae]|uniref:Uncharacterized protein n=1 Tax=Puccinia coronata f. sp. avenae TaxID=200324 RepID=A0A2N5VZQ1_9BASI|nr:hypothetical protein PCANC_02157 [Puccinia coronata f. sp. avenae]
MASFQAKLAEEGTSSSGLYRTILLGPQKQIADYEAPFPSSVRDDGGESRPCFLVGSTAIFPEGEEHLTSNGLDGMLARTNCETDSTHSESERR